MNRTWTALFSIIIFGSLTAIGTGGESADWMKVTPRNVVLANASINHRVHGLAIVSQDSEESWCPYEEWEWGDGSISGQGGDCPPYAEAGPTVARPKRYERYHTYRTAGRMTVVFRLKKGSQVIQTLAQDIYIRVGATSEDEVISSSGIEVR